MAKKTRIRNNRLYDPWSLVHLTTGILLGWAFSNPFIALLIMAAYEPVEVLILSPILWRYGITFGYESWRNSLSDVVFDGIGIAVGSVLLAGVAVAPFQLF